MLMYKAAVIHPIYISYDYLLIMTVYISSSILFNPNIAICRHAHDTS